LKDEECKIIENTAVMMKEMCSFLIPFHTSIWLYFRSDA